MFNLFINLYVYEVVYSIVKKLLHCLPGERKDAHDSIRGDHCLLTLVYPRISCLIECASRTCSHSSLSDFVFQ